MFQKIKIIETVKIKRFLILLLHDIVRAKSSTNTGNSVSKTLAPGVPPPQAYVREIMNIFMIKYDPNKRIKMSRFKASLFPFASLIVIIGFK